MNYFEAYRDIWNFHKKYIENVCNDDVYWEAVINEADIIAKKYHCCQFITNLLFAEITEFERICKEVKADGDTRI